MRRKSRPVWRTTVTKDTGESLTLKLYRSPFPQQFVLNRQLRSATSVAAELQAARPEHVVLIGITKMQWRQGVLDVTCDGVAPIAKP